MVQQLRLKRSDDIRSVFRLGTRINNRFFILNYHLNEGPDSRFAVIIGKSFGKAVDRNRAKRKSRHLFYLVKGSIHPACDILFRPRVSLLKEKRSIVFMELERSLELAGIYRGKK